jgi:hypothetical protein
LSASEPRSISSASGPGASAPSKPVARLPSSLSIDERLDYLRTGKIPPRTPKITDRAREPLEKAARSSLAIAQREGKQPHIVDFAQRALNCLGDEAQRGDPEQLERVRGRYFTRNAADEWILKTPAAAPPAPPEAARTRNTRFFREVWQHDPRAFETAVEEIGTKAPFLKALFTDASRMGEGIRLFEDLSTRLKDCPKGGGVHYKLTFPRAYGNGEITHVADVIFDKEGHMHVIELTTFRHLAMVLTAFDTAEFEERYRMLTGHPPPPDDGVAEGFKRGGMHFTFARTVASCTELVAPFKAWADWCRQPEVFHRLYYAGNPDRRLVAAGDRIRDAYRRGEAPEAGDVALVKASAFKQPLGRPPGWFAQHPLAWNWSCQWLSTCVSAMAEELRGYRFPLSPMVTHVHSTCLLIDNHLLPRTNKDFARIVGYDSKSGKHVSGRELSQDDLDTMFWCAARAEGNELDREKTIESTVFLAPDRRSKL